LNGEADEFGGLVEKHLKQLIGISK